MTVYERHASGLWLPESAIEPAAPLGIDLFSGAGGFSCGFKQAGWHVIAAADGWATAACTYLLNLGSPATRVHLVGDELPEGTAGERAWFREHAGETVTAAELFAAFDIDAAPGTGWIASKPGIRPCEHYYLGDICALTGDRILEDLELAGDDVGCVFGGPPCQGFSRAGKRRRDDERNELVFEFMRVVCEIRPQSFCMENVPGMLDMVTRDGIPVIDAIARIAEDGRLGTFEAIRRSLLETSGAGIALTRKSPAPSPARSAGEREQMALELEEAAWEAGPLYCGVRRTVRGAQSEEVPAPVGVPDEEGERDG